jgi:hypothetical protein
LLCYSCHSSLLLALPTTFSDTRLCSLLSYSALLLGSPTRFSYAALLLGSPTLLSDSTLILDSPPRSLCCSLCNSVCNSDCCSTLLYSARLCYLSRLLTSATHLCFSSLLLASASLLASAPRLCSSPCSSLLLLASAPLLCPSLLLLASAAPRLLASVTPFCCLPLPLASASRLSLYPEYLPRISTPNIYCYLPCGLLLCCCLLLLLHLVCCLICPVCLNCLLYPVTRKTKQI